MKKAFTLVELLVVISIMAILTIVTVSQFRTARKRANDVARKGDLNSVAKALQLYFADYGVMPEENIINDNWGKEFKDGDYTYMIKLPTENTEGWPQYCYKTDSTRKKYALFAKLEVESDKECENNEFDCGDVIMDYCYVNASPNTSIGVCGNFPEEDCIRAEVTITNTPIPSVAPKNTPTPTVIITPAELTPFVSTTPTSYIDPQPPPLEEM
ncbi:MAG TPA: type II secretion system protein [Candidatus Woesebacteria bacterium]|nr:type II secretion system protein [Candidatus Woesebacteria bacterium]